MKAKSVLTVAVGVMLLRNSYTALATSSLEFLEPTTVLETINLYERAPELPVIVEEIEEEVIEEPQEPEIETYITDSPVFNSDGMLNTEYRQTYYSVQQGETKLGSGLNKNSANVEVVNNIMHYNDSEYGLIPIYALNMDVVTDSGQDSRGTWNIYGSVIELTKGEETWYGYVGDACGACRYNKKIDLWVYNNDQSLDVDNISFRFVRYGQQNLNGDELNENR